MTERPWARVKRPLPIPDPPTREALTELPDDDFLLLLRSHMVPPAPRGPERHRWNIMWAELADDDDLRDRAYDALEDAWDATEAFLESADPEEPQRPRAEKFCQRCQEAWNRLDRDEHTTLRRTGLSRWTFNRPARDAIDRLVAAIDEHRDAVTAHHSGRRSDHRLWAALATTGLDPAGTPDEEREAPKAPSGSSRDFPVLRRTGVPLRRFNIAARVVLEQLVAAVDEHRRTIGGQEEDVDRRLWATLNEVGLDPAARRTSRVDHRPQGRDNDA